MADATRARGPASKPAQGGYARKVKTNAAASAAKNQQPSSPLSSAAASSAASTVLPRIYRRGVDASVSRNEPAVMGRPIASPQGRDLVSVPIPIPTPPRRPSSKAATVSSMENSPTYNGDDLDGPSAKTAWSTPRSPTPTDVDRPHLTAFFASSAESDAGGSVSIALATPTRLKSVEETLAATEELYRVDLGKLHADNDKLFEISTSALQHVEVMQSELPILADSSQHTKDALNDLCSDIATLHQQHEEAQQRMLERLTSTADANADEMVALTELHASEKAQLMEKHVQEMQDTCASFETKIRALEQKISDTEASYKEQLEHLRASSEAQLQALQASSEADLEVAKETAQAELEALEKLSSLKLEALDTSSREQLERREKELQEQLETLRASSAAACEELRTTSTSTYERLRRRSEAELAELQRSSQEELTSVRTTLTSEIEALKRDSAAEIATLKAKSSQEIQDLRRQKEEELANVQATLTAECARITREASDERACLTQLRAEQLSQLEERRVRETTALSSKLEEARSSHSNEVTALHTQYKSRIASMEDKYSTETAENKASHVAQVNDLVRKAETELSETVARYEDKLRSLSESHDTEMKHTTQQAALERESLVTKYDRQASEAEEERRREREALVLGYETKMESLKRSTRDQLEKSTKAHETYVGQLREVHDAKVLLLMTSLREQDAQLTETLADRSAELEQCEKRIRELEESRKGIRTDFRNFSERSDEAIARKEMEVSQQEALVLRLDEELRKTQALFDDTQRKLKLAEDDRQVKAGTILELTFVIKSRDEEIDKLRNSLLDSVKTVNTKTEILELTAETLSSKAKELEDTRAALRIESGRLSMVEESMLQKEGMLEDTTLKIESMRLNMENMRLEMKRMQMDMKLQLEHTEGETELKNGEIRRLHGSVSELKLKNDFFQQTVERLEESLGVATRQVDEAQRRINLLKLEATNSADELKRTSDLLGDKERELLVASKEKQALTSEKSRLQIQLNNLTLLLQRLREEAERHAMDADETQANYRHALEKTIAEKDERLRAEKHLLMLELNASRDMVSYLEGVEERYKNASGELDTHKSQRAALEVELNALRDSAKRMEEELHACQLKIREQSSTISELKDAAEVSETRYSTQLEAERRRISDLHMAIEDVGEKLQEALASAHQLEREKKQLHEDVARATQDHAFLLASINEEKTGIFETMSSLKKELADSEKDLEQVRDERARLQKVSESTQIKLDRALDELTHAREDLASRNEVCSRLHEDSLSTIREISEKAEGAVNALTLELKRVEEDKLESLHRMQETNTDALRRLEDEKNQTLQRVQAEKDEAMGLVDEEKCELLRIAEEEKLALLRQAEEEKCEILPERQLRETASRDHRAQERERLRRLAKYEQKRLLELNELAQMLAEEQQTRLVAELHRTKDENASLLVENCLTKAAAKLQLVHGQEELRKMADDECICLLKLNEASRMVTEKHRARLLDKKMERQRLMDEEQAARLLEQHAREQMTKEEECALLLDRHEHSQLTIAQQRERFSEQHERFVMWNAEYETRLLAHYLADVDGLQDGHAVEQAKLASELAEVKRILDEQAAKTDADKLEWEKLHTSTLLTTAERHQTELDTSIRSVREENAMLREKHKAELGALAKDFDQKSKMIRLRTSQEHLLKINEMLEKSRAEEQKHTAIVDEIKQELEAKSAELAAATRQLEDQDRAMRVVEATLNAKRFDTEAHLNANLLELEVNRDATQQELEIQLNATENALAEANQVLAVKTAVIESLRKELAIVLETSEGTRSDEQLVSLLRQQLETYLFEEHHMNLAELSDVRLDSERDVLECMKDYFAMRCRPRPVISHDSASTALLTVEYVRLHLQDYDCVSALLRGESAASDEATPSSGDAASKAVMTLQHNLALLRSSIKELIIGGSEDSQGPLDADSSALVGILGSFRGFFDKLQLSTASESERASRQEEVLEVVAQHERLMQAISTSSERDEVHSVDDVCVHFDKLEKMLARAREVTESDKFRCLTDFERILDECELRRRQIGDFKQGSLRNAAAEGDSGGDPTSENMSAEPLPTNFVSAADVATLLHEFEAFVADCRSALDLDPHHPEDPRAPTEAILEAIRELMSILHHFEMLQPQLGSPRRCGIDSSEMASSPGKPPLRNKVAVIVAFVDELKSMSEFAQGILNEECEAAAGVPSELNSDISSASLVSLRYLTRTPTPTVGLMEAGATETLEENPAYHFDDLELNIAVNVIEAPEFNDQDRYDEELEAMPALSASPSAFMADSLLDISLVMSDHQRLLAETAHLVGKATRQANGSKRNIEVGKEISRLVREHCALLALTRRLFKVRDARHDLPSLLECVAILQRFTQRLPLLGSQPSGSADDSSNNSSISLSSVPQALTWSQGLVHSRSSASSLTGSNNDSDAAVASNSTSFLTSSEQVTRSSLSIFATIEEVARHLQDYDYLVQQLRKKHKAELPATAFTSVESLASALSDKVDALTRAQQLLGLDNAVVEVPQVAGAVHDVVQHTQHLVLQQKRSLATDSADGTSLEVPDLIVNPSSAGLEVILARFEAIALTLTEFSALLTWLRQMILQVPVTRIGKESEDTSSPPVETLDMTSISDLKQHVRDFVSHLCDLQTANHELKQELAAMQHAQQQMLHELRNESEMLSRLDTSAVDTDPIEPSSPQRRRADVLETLLARQETFQQQSSFHDREHQREAVFLRGQALLASDLSDVQGDSNGASKLGVSNTTRLAIYKRLLDDKQSLERQLQQLRQELASTISRHEAEMQEFHRQAELVRQHDRDAVDEQIAALKRTLVVETEKLTQKCLEAEARVEVDKHEVEQRINEITQHQQDTESRLDDEKNALESQLSAHEQALADAKQSAATDVSALEQALAAAKTRADAEITNLEQTQREQQAKFEQQLANWKHLAQAALDEEMAYLRKSDSLAFAASELQCFSDGSISDKDEERRYSRLNVWKALVAHIDRLSDWLSAVEQRDASEYELLRTNGLVEDYSSDDAPPLTAVRTALFRELKTLRSRESMQRRELEDEAAFVRSDIKMEFDESQPTASRQRVYKALLDGQNALIDDKMERELETARENAFLEANKLQFDNRMSALEHLVRVCDQLELVKKQLDEERDLLVEQRVCTPQELRRPLRSRDDESRDTAADTESEESDPPSLGEFASIRLDVYRKLLANEQRARDEMKEREAGWEKKLQEECQSHEAALETAMSELQRHQQAEIASMTCIIEQLELAIMLREDAISGLPDRLAKHQAMEKARQQQHFEEERQKEMADALARWSAQTEVAIAAATATATTNAAALVEDTHTRELERMKLECDEAIASLSDAHAKQLALVSAVRTDSEAQAKQQVDESAARQVAKVRAGFLERLAKRNGAAVATIYRCIRMATDVLNPSAFVTTSATISADTNAVHPSRHGSTGSPGTGGGGEKIPVAVTHSVVALVKELKALKEHVATSLDQLQGDEVDNTEAAPPLSISSSFLLGTTANSNTGTDSSATDIETTWTEGNDQVADAILCAYREIMQYASRQLLTRQQAANDALSRLYALILGEEAVAASLAAETRANVEEELKQQRGTCSVRLALEIELTRERTAREDAECKQKLHDVCVRRLLEDQRSMEAALSKALETSQLECKQLQTRIEQLEHYQRLALTSSSGFQSSPSAARMVTPTRGFGASGGNSNMMAMPMRPERPRDYPSSFAKGGGTAHKERFVSDLEKETGQRRTTANSNAISISGATHGDGGGAMRRRRQFPGADMDTSSLALSSGPSTATRGSLQDQELWFQGVRTFYFVSFFVSVFYVPKQGVFRVEVLNSDTEQQQTVYVTRAEMQQFVAQHERDKRRRHGYGGSFDSEQDDEARIDDPARRGDVVDALFEHVKVYGEGTSNMLLAFE